MNPLTALARKCRSIAYDYNTKSGRIDMLHQHVTLPRESFIYAFRIIDPEVQTIEVLRMGKFSERHTCPWSQW